MTTPLCSSLFLPQVIALKECVDTDHLLSEGVTPGITYESTQGNAAFPSGYSSVAPLSDADLAALLMASPLYKKLEDIKKTMDDADLPPKKRGQGTGLIHLSIRQYYSLVYKNDFQDSLNCSNFRSTRFLLNIILCFPHTDVCKHCFLSSLKKIHKHILSWDSNPLPFFFHRTRGKCRVYSAYTHRCKSKNQLIFLIPSAN